MPAKFSGTKPSLDVTQLISTGACCYDAPMSPILRLLLVSLIPLLFGCTDSAKDNPDQHPDRSDPPQTVIFCADCQLVDVLGVIDGDTIDTSIGRVRFYGVDTPERDEACYTEATEFTRLLVGEQVRLEDGPRLQDNFRRRLAYLYDAFGNSIDVQLIAGGYATAWTGDGQHRDILIGLEESARSNQAGCLW